jgi:hypothetical protein
VATPRAAEHRDLEQRFRNLEAGMAELTNTVLRRQPVQVGSVQVDTVVTPETANAVWTIINGDTLDVPEGYTRALVNMYAAHGVTFTGAGVLGVQPICTNHFGPPVSTGAPSAGALSVVSAGAFVLANLAGPLDFGVQINRNGAVAAGSQNFHISASVIFLR